MRCGGVREQPFCIKNKEFVDAIRQYLVLYLPFDASSSYNRVELYTQLIGQLTAFGKEFLSGRGVIYVG